jgi:hypothetical protein
MPNIKGHVTKKVAMTVANVDLAVADGNSEARTVFTTAFADVLAQTLAVAVDDIAVDTLAAQNPGILRRWLQDQVLVDVEVSFTITTDAIKEGALAMQIDELRNTKPTTIRVGDRSTADTSSFTQPTITPQDGPSGIQCREGHDPASPLCHVCLDGAQIHQKSNASSPLLL